MLKLRSLVLAVFFAAAAACAAMSAMVRINYDMVDYLPDDTPATVALDTMKASYDSAVPNLRVLVRDVSIPEALDYKSRIKAVTGVRDIDWLDDTADVKVPLQMQDEKTVTDWYARGNALFSVVVNEENQQAALTEIREIIGERGAMSGNPVDTVSAQHSTASEIQRMMLFIIPSMVLILMATTQSWFVPARFLINVGVAIVLNMGTNLIFGEISFITRTTGAILQLACSMDYAIFLLDRFEELRLAGAEPLGGMAQAVKKTASSILSSGLTTVVGFLALAAMRFKVGPDMGFVLAKGIAISLLVTLVFLPCLTMCCWRLVEKTMHRSFMPSFSLLARFTNRVKAPVAVTVLLLLIPCFLAQQQISFMYGMSGMAAPGSQVRNDRDTINALFGESSSYALLVPKGSPADEQALNDEIKALPEVSSVKSFVENVGKTIPPQFVPPDQLRLLNSDRYTRFVITVRVPAESDRTFSFVEKLRAVAARYYPDTYHLAGESVNVYDIKKTIMADSVKVNIIAVGAIAVILLLAFRSFSLPLFLLLTIESSIIINVSVPYFTGLSLNYIGFLIISSVQLGATVDYAILFAGRYLENRVKLPKKAAVLRTIQDSAGSILTSAGIMTTAGLVLGLISTNSVISQLGILIARGASLSALLVLVLLPALLGAMEPLIKKTTRKLTLFSPSEITAEEATV
jgi:predicted RND superfamily exporter protein